MRRRKSYVGTEPAPTLADVGQGLSHRGPAEVCRRNLRSVGTLASRESLSVRGELGQQPGGCLPQPVVALDLLPAWRCCRAALRLPRTISAIAFGAWPSYRALPFDLLFSQHAFNGRSGGLVLCRRAVPGTAVGGTMEESRLENHIAGGAAPGPPRWPALRAVALLSRLCDRLLPALSHSFGA